MGINLIEWVDLAAYRLNRVAQTWFKEWKEGRWVDAGPIDLDEFVTDFLDRFFPRELRKSKV